MTVRVNPWVNVCKQLSHKALRWELKGCITTFSIEFFHFDRLSVSITIKNYKKVWRENAFSEGICIWNIWQGGWVFDCTVVWRTYPALKTFEFSSSFHSHLDDAPSPFLFVPKEKKNPICPKVAVLFWFHVHPE